MESVLVNVTLLASLVLISHFFAKRNLIKEWFTPISRRLKEFAVGFIYMVLICIAFQWIIHLLFQSSWAVNESFKSKQILSAFIYDFNSVLLEELLFRALLILALIHILREKYLVILCGFIFGVYHWFTFGILGQLWPMTLVLISTGLMGAALAFAYLKSKSLLLPLGIHLGWNSTNHILFSNGPKGLMVLEKLHPKSIDIYQEYTSFFLYILIALSLFIVISILFQPKHRPS